MKTRIMICVVTAILVIALASGCKKEENDLINNSDQNPKIDVPIITTNVVVGITSVNAQSGGDITNDGGATITERGVCWSNSDSPTTANLKTTDGTGTGSFASCITNLNPNTRYYVRAYATNSKGTGYGNTLSFKTNALSIGQNYQGGKVFYVDATGQHGLIAWLGDYNNADYTWGLANIFCNEGTWDGYNDWRLPTKVELNLLYQHKNAIGGFANANYWSSTYYDYYYEARYWYQSFYNGAQGYMWGSNEARVRAIRTF